MDVQICFPSGLRLKDQGWQSGESLIPSLMDSMLYSVSGNQDWLGYYEIFFAGKVVEQ